jgi:hypothetical protein
MLYLIWKKQLQLLIEKRYETALGYETWCDWKEYFIEGMKPHEALLAFEKSEAYTF